jgi:isochorismate hydrolase
MRIVHVTCGVSMYVTCGVFMYVTCGVSMYVTCGVFMYVTCVVCVCVAMVRDIRSSVLGQRVANIYDLSDKIYLFKFAVPGVAKKVSE